MSNTAVVILNWNGAHMLRQFLPSVITHSGDAEIWVADNASTDQSLQLLATEFPTVRTLLLQRNFGFAEGYNRALQQINAKYYVLLNSDVEVTPNWLQPLLHCMEHHPEVAAVQPKLLKYAKSTSPHPHLGPSLFEYAGASGGFIDRFGYPYCRGRIFSHVEADQGQYDEPLEIHWATGACLLVRAQVYHSEGGLDPRFFAHNEEIDLCWRMRIHGYKIMCIPQSHVYHLGGGTLPQGNPHKTYLNFRNNLTMLYKNLPQHSLRHVLLVRTLLDYVAVLQSLLKGNLADAKAICKARIDFHAWSKLFRHDRFRIQQARKLSPRNDLAPHSILWQYYVLRKTTWAQLPKNQVTP